ncbi:unnamed protein product [Didymodactylos carnosus]|uniref:Large ribosomal subunit protein P2 n=1 Tax=Didymodactylos carnosus TaxID=1234261 RepID=A0A813WNV6_9BILA|nr:unnamed protein product [Didymodactylos carnosus]
MRYAAAYVLAILAGNTTPDVKSISKILGSVGIDCDETKAKKVIDACKGKDVNQLIEEAPAAAAATTAPSAGADKKKEAEKAAPKKEEKKEESDDDDIGAPSLLQMDVNDIDEETEEKEKTRTDDDDDDDGETPIVLEKWNCSFCTYANFASSKLCTMCRVERRLDENELTISSDIYQLNSSEQPITSYIDSVEKWPCQICTYLNYPKSMKCIQCRSTRVTSTITPAQVQRSLSTNDNDRISPPQTPATSSSSSTTNLLSDSKIIAQRLRKWMCKKCTYENYPSSKKCVMCLHLRANNLSSCTSSSSSSTCGHTTDEEQRMNAINKSMENIAVDRKEKREKRTIQHSQPQQIMKKTSSISATLPVERLWLKACETLLDGGPLHVVAEYLAYGCDPLRQLTMDDIKLLNMKNISYIDCVGKTLKQLAFLTGQLEQYQTLENVVLQFKQQQQQLIRQTMKKQQQQQHQRTRHVPANICPTLIELTQWQFRTFLRLKKTTEFQCYYLTECFTFTLPAEIGDFHHRIQDQVFEDLLDKNVQQELEVDNSIINWNTDIANRLHSRLYALWNRNNGDCLLDSVLQVCLGVFDTENSLRRAMAESLQNGSAKFFELWREYEQMVAEKHHYRPDDCQLRSEWNLVLSLANQPGESLEHAHIFALSHVLRRPVIVYGVTYVKSYRGEYNIGLARFQGVYLPLLWEPNFCFKSPICLGYTRNHFSALVPMQEHVNRSSIQAAATIQLHSPSILTLMSTYTDNNSFSSPTMPTSSNSSPSSSPPPSLSINRHSLNTNENSDTQTFYHPLMDSDGNLLPVHFISPSEIGHEQTILKQWLDCCWIGQTLVAQQKVGKRPSLIQNLLDQWLNLYRQQQPYSNNQIRKTSADSR